MEKIYQTFYNRQQGFTLAEVLITLGIIGIVASMTIPTLISNASKQQTAEKLKRIYSVLMQAKQTAVNTTGASVDQWFTSDVADGTAAGADKFVNTYIIPYLNVAKTCGLSITGECLERVYYLTQSRGYDDSWFNNNTSKFFLNDGTLIGVEAYDTGNNRFDVIVDINGQAQPNTWGKDVFLFYYYPNGNFIPEGLYGRNASFTNTNWGCNKNGGRGLYCSGLIMIDNWRIADDYPW